MTKRIGILHFSPTSTTKKVCTAIAMGMGSKDFQVFDMTFPRIRESIIDNPKTVFENIDHLIVGAPVYTGKLPLQVVECVRAINGNRKESTAIVVYGNRDYGIALIRIIDFSSVQSGAFYHLYSHFKYDMANHRRVHFLKNIR
jgi:flavorubredoxin